MTRGVLQMALDWIEAASHDKDCHLTTRRESSPLDECNCGKDVAEFSIRAELAKPDGWQSIESAPKDGTHVMLCNGVTVSMGEFIDMPPYSKEVRDIDGHYIDQDESDGYTGWMDYGGGMLPEPTHWMPLPAAPSMLGKLCRDDGRCQYAIDHGAEGMGHCPLGKCAMPSAPHPAPE